MMEIFQWFLQPSSAAGLVASMMDLSIKATFIFALAGIATSLTRRRPAAVRHAIWMAAVTGVLILPVVSAVVPSWKVLPVETANLLPEEGAQQPASLLLAEELSVVLPESFVARAPEAQDTVGGRRSDTAASDQAPTVALPEASSEKLASSGNTFVTSVKSLGATVASIHWSVLVFGSWILGLLLVLGHNLVGAIGLHLVARRANPVESREWLDLAEELGDRLWITRPVTLLKSHVTTMPVTWGGRRPVVLLPSDMDSWSDEERRHVLTHEFAHIRRWDCTTQWVAQFACALHWFNPLMWVATRRLRVERERACDDHVILAGGRPSSYAQNLLNIASSLRATVASPLGAVAMAKPSQLEGRVLSILDPERHRMSFTKNNSGVVFGLAALFILPIAAMTTVPEADSRILAAPESPNTPSVVAGNAVGVPLDSADDATGEVYASPVGAARSVGTPESAPFSDALLSSPATWIRPEVVLPDTIETRKRRVADAFMKALGDPDEDIRVQAARMLGELEDERSIPALTSAMRNDESADVRRAALWALSEMESDAVLPALFSMAGSEQNADARRQIAWMIGEHAHKDDRRAGEVLIGMLDDENAEVRATAVWGLAEMEYAPAISKVVRLVDDPDREVRQRAVWAISEISDGAPTEEVVAVLISAMKSADADVRVRAVNSLGELESLAAVPALISALEDDDVRIRRRAAWALGEIEAEEAVRALSTSLEDENEDVRRASANALMEIGSSNALRSLASAINNANADVRRQAIYAIAEMEDPEHLDILMQAAQDGDVRIRKTAIGALAEMEDDRATDALVEALTDESSQVRRFAAYGLGELDSSPRVILGLTRALRDKDTSVRKAAVNALGELESVESVDALIDALSDEDADIRRAAAYALGDILDDTAHSAAVGALSNTLSTDPNPGVRKASAYALGDIGSAEAFEVLRAAMDDENRDVRRAAAQALGSIDWDEVEDREKDRHRNRNRDQENGEGDWDLSVSMDSGTMAGVGELIGAVIGGVAETAVHSALGAIDVETIVHQIAHQFDHIDVEMMVDEISVELLSMDEEMRLVVGGEIATALAEVAWEMEDSKRSQTALRALQRMDHPRARYELRRLKDR